MALSNPAVYSDVVALMSRYADYGLSTSMLTTYLASAYNYVQMLLYEQGVDHAKIDSDDSVAFKRVIVFKALELIYQDLQVGSGEGNERFAEQQADWERRFDDAWPNIQYTVDTDDDGTGDTEVEGPTIVTLRRS